MINTAIKTKFYLAPHVYYTKNERGSFMLYNTDTGERIESDSISCRNLIERIYEPANLGVIDMEENFMDNETDGFIKEIIAKKFGKIIEQKEGAPQYINLLPILNLQSDMERLKIDKESSPGEDLIKYLNELNLYINDDDDNLNLSTIKSLLDSLNYSQLSRINMHSDNVFSYSLFPELLSLLKEYHFDYHFWNNYVNFVDSKLIDHNYSYDVNISFPIRTEPLIRCLELLEENKAHYHFYITSEKEYEEAESLINDFEINSYSFHPVYAGDNLRFFEENVYLSEEDIFEDVIPFRHIFRNQKLNSNYFGKLYILPDGSVKASKNSPILGNLKNNSILEIIYNELELNTAWRKVRDGYPCNQCLYQFLCPPPSDHEIVIGKNNLCHINP